MGRRRGVAPNNDGWIMLKPQKAFIYPDTDTDTTSEKDRIKALTAAACRAGAFVPKAGMKGGVGPNRIVYRGIIHNIKSLWGASGRFPHCAEPAAFLFGRRSVLL